MSHRHPLVLAAALCAATLLVGAAPAVAGWEPDYGSRTEVTFGANTQARMPVTLVLPVPASGGAVTSVRAQWNEQVPQHPGGTARVSKRFDASACTTGSSCTVTDVLPTAGMVNGTPSVTFVVSNAEGTVSFFDRRTEVANPKPSVTFTSPAPDEALWGEVTLAAAAAPSGDPGAAPLAGVRFYVDGGLGADTAYVFDASAPYAITLPATDIAPVLGSRRLVVVAEDADGNLSQLPAGTTGQAGRQVTVGPPPLAAWTSPRTAGAVRGSVRNGVELELHAALPGTAPDPEGHHRDPFVREFEVLLDGASVGTSSYDEPASWNGYEPGRRLRAIDAWWPLSAAQGLTRGRHTVTVVVRTSYNSVTEIRTPVLVADGVVRTGPVRSGGRKVRNGFTVTAGSQVRFSVPVATRVAGTGVVWTEARIGRRSLLSAGCRDHARCDDATTLRTDVWTVPRRAGTRTLAFTAHAGGDAADTFTRTIRIVPATGR